MPIVAIDRLSERFVGRATPVPALATFAPDSCELLPVQTIGTEGRLDRTRIRRST